MHSRNVKGNYCRWPARVAKHHSNEHETHYFGNAIPDQGALISMLT